MKVPGFRISMFSDVTPNLSNNVSYKEITRTFIAVIFFSFAPRKSCENNMKFFIFECSVDASK